MDNYQDDKLLNLIKHIGVLDEIEQESVNADIMDDVYDIVIMLKESAWQQCLEMLKWLNV